MDKSFFTSLVTFGVGAFFGWKILPELFPGPLSRRAQLEAQATALDAQAGSLEAAGQATAAQALRGQAIAVRREAAQL